MLQDRFFDRAPSSAGKAAQGAFAGFLATVPMTVLMGILFQILPRPDQYPLPPWQGTRKILVESAEAAGKEEQVDNEKVTVTTAFTHFGYGAASGVAYALTANRARLHPVWKGLLAGLGLWTLSYGGYLPALGILRPITQRSTGRNLVMLVSNLAWGLFTALLLNRMDQERSD
jgi:uncharacterized membrane protein YagU involved in acid resistance